MEIPPEITYRNMEKSDAIDELIREKAAKLDEMHDKLISCRIAVEKVLDHQASGSPYNVRIVLRVPPNKELVVNREPAEGQVNERLTTAVNSAFDAIRRQLLKLKGKRQGEVKGHPNPELIGHVVRLFPEEDYGFIRTTEGRELFFHRNSVLHDDYGRLEIGTGVRYFEREGEKGPQASTVQIVDKPGARAAHVPEAHVLQPQGWEP